MKKIKKNYGFTLIELIVAITITSLVLVSIVEIFIFSNSFAKKVDISRIMQENIKNFTEIIAEDIRNNKVQKNGNELYSSGITLKTGSGTNITEYFLAYKNNGNITQINTSDIEKCKSYKTKDRCFLARKKGKNTEALVNSWVSFEDLKFYISTGTTDGINGLAKVTMTFTVRPASKKGLSINKIKKATIHYQTTFSQRLYDYK